LKDDEYCSIIKFYIFLKAFLDICVSKFVLSCWKQQQSSKVKLLPIAKNSSKLKEDITSLGSDDSGICGSDSSAETRPKGSEETIATEEVKVDIVY